MGKCSGIGKDTPWAGMLLGTLLTPHLPSYLQVLEKGSASTERSKRRERAWRDQVPDKKQKGVFLESCRKRKGCAEFGC